MDSIFLYPKYAMALIHKETTDGGISYQHLDKVYGYNDQYIILTKLYNYAFRVRNKGHRQCSVVAYGIKNKLDLREFSSERAIAYGNISKSGEVAFTLKHPKDGSIVQLEASQYRHAIDMIYQLDSRAHPEKFKKPVIKKQPESVKPAIKIKDTMRAEKSPTLLEELAKALRL